ncbi:MAG: hypothetical protein P1U47_12890 [Zhongshania sp.]|uniref:hypothetical protein n=1 Tax=Zhongshania sp. TaxID=1971902 RepID=UPI00262370E2|nr:hypothetical protein [Zhongshania sp.]MDF1693269.1 hypothetical protein [Zhongshania sp.]
MKYSLALLGIFLVMSHSARAADWKACRARKVEVVRLEQALGAGKKLKGYASGTAMKKARRSKEDWLWKHCRSYSRRLRDVERDMM